MPGCNTRHYLTHFTSVSDFPNSNCYIGNAIIGGCKSIIGMLPSIVWALRSAYVERLALSPGMENLVWISEPHVP